ncbi:MAG: C4-dicarboxylate ABC transporter [Gemmatimonadetes bacterium]|nr:C4-dicarboxylate ABC transporter [Gemmatimonadota bacterium]MEE3040476.1 TRAP transporter large permease subunit [Candidatus Latescibacterota bacterium]
MIPAPVATGLSILLASIGTPLFVIIICLALLSFATGQVDLTIVFIEMYRLADMPALTAIPLFALCGFLLARSGAAHRLVGVSQALLGWLPGGLAVMALSICALLTAFTGASGMTIVAVGGLLFPALQEQRFPEKFSLGLLTTSGSLGLLFPPSIPLIVYAIVAEVPVDDLFLAGIAPGLVMVFCLGVYSVYVGRGLPPPPAPELNAFQALKEGALELALPVVVIIGIYSGFIAVSEAAALSVLYVLCVEMLVHREIKPRHLPGIVRDTMILVGGIFVIIAAATAYTSYLVDAQIPAQLLEWIRGSIDSKLLFLILLNLFLLAVGCMIDMFSALVVVVPLILPIAEAYGVHPVHLGIIFLANLEIGYSTPPVGLNLFIASARLKRPILDLYRASLPFLLILLGVLLVITYFPQLSLFTLD